MTTLFSALHEEDLAKFDSVTAPSFYIFDNGKRFDGDAVMGVIKELHASGKRFEWHVTDADVRIKGDAAWIAYVNQGSITAGGKTVPQEWLESGFLTRQAGVWKLEFMQSTRVPPRPPAPE